MRLWNIFIILQLPLQRGLSASTLRLRERPDFLLLQVLWNWRLRRRQHALTESCRTQTLACGFHPLKVHVSSWRFSSTRLGNIGFCPLGPQFVFKLSGKMQKTHTTSMPVEEATQPLILYATFWSDVLWSEAKIQNEHWKYTVRYTLYPVLFAE